jgi:hypothetical protein
MKSAMSNSEKEVRGRFDFSKGVRGKFHERYQKAHSVTLLEGDPVADDEPPVGDSQLVEIAGKHLLISRLVSAGYEVAEPLRDKGIDLIVYRDDDQFSAFPVQMKAFTHESFSLHRKYEKFRDLRIAYVWNVNSGNDREIYLLTFDEALKVMDAKGYSKADSWTKGHYYFVRKADKELKALLKPYRMQPRHWHDQILAVG